MSHVVQTTRGGNVIFIHSSLDDAGLTASQFRVYAHLSRRACNETDECFPSIETIAKKCAVHEDTVREALKELENRRMVEIQPVPGRSNRYYLTPPGRWVVDPSESKGGVQPDLPPRKEGSGPPESNGVAPPKRGETKDIHIRKSNKVDPVLPLELRSERAQRAWDEWFQHRREIKKPMTETSATKQIKNLRQWGEERWVAAIEHSISCSYQGIFEPRTNGNHQSNGHAKPVIDRNKGTFNETIPEGYYQRIAESRQ